MRSHVGETAPFVVCPTWIGHALSSCHWDYLASKSLGSHALASTLESFQLPVAAERVQGCASSKHSKGDAKVTDTLNSQVFYSHRMCFISGGSPLQVGHVLDKHGTFHIEHFISLYSMNWLLRLAWCEVGSSFRSSSRSTPTLLRKSENGLRPLLQMRRDSFVWPNAWTIYDTNQREGLAEDHPTSPWIKRTSNGFMSV